MGELEGVEDDQSSEGEVIDDDDEDSSDDGDDEREQLFFQIFEKRQVQVSSNALLTFALPSLPSFSDMHVDQAVEDEDPVEAAPQPYLPTSRPLEKDEILEPDQSVYEMLHRMNVQWPCLSFDVLRVSSCLLHPLNISSGS